MSSHFSSPERIAAAETQARIDHFALAQQLERHEYQAADGRTIVTLEQPRLAPIGQDRLDHYFAAQASAEARGIPGNCWGIAFDATFDGHVSGRIFTDTGAQAFCGYDDHEINLDALADKSVLGIDFTAAVNLDHGQGNMAIFGIRAKRVGKLVTYLNGLYGGNWRPVRHP